MKAKIVDSNVGEIVPGANASTLFFASTLGQVRNVATLLTRLESEGALVVCLFTTAKPEILTAMTAYLETRNIPSVSLLLPRSPSSGLPWVIKDLDRRYTNLLTQNRPIEIWISSMGGHYALLAKRASELGCSVNYFEEGLGTYKTFEEQIIPVLPITERARQLGSQTYQVARRLKKNSLIFGFILGFPFSMLKELKSYFFAFRSFTFQLTQFVVKSPLRQRLAPFFLDDSQLLAYSAWTDFDQAWVAAPDKLDPKIFGSSNAHQLDWHYNPEGAKDIKETLEMHSWDRISTLYVSQNYGGASSDFYQAVAASIAKRKPEVIAIKWHPKETDAQRTMLKTALIQLEVEFVDLSIIPPSPVETYFETGNFTEVIGLCSSALVYGKMYFKEVEFTSILPAVLDRLSKTPGFSREVLKALKNDRMIYDRFLA